MKKEKQIKIAIKFADIDNRSYSGEGQQGWVNGFARLLEQALAFYFSQPLLFRFFRETEAISEDDFQQQDAIIYILSPAFVLSSNMEADLALIEKACMFDAAFINTKIYKVLKGLVNIHELPVSISLGRFYHFYQSTRAESGYETLYHWDSTPVVRRRYWESLSSLLFELLKNLGHEQHQCFIPQNTETLYLGQGDLEQLWNRRSILGELNARGFHILPDHDHSMEVKHLNDPVKFYLSKCEMAIHFPEEFIPLTEKNIRWLSEPEGMKHLIWFDPEAEKEQQKKQQYEELKLQLKNLDQVEAISSGLEELKEIILALGSRQDAREQEGQKAAQPVLYLIYADHFQPEAREHLDRILGQMNIRVLEQEATAAALVSGQEKRNKHYQYLKEADYSLVCYGGGNPEWLRANINELKKAAGLHAGKDRQIRIGLIAGAAVGTPELSEYTHAIPLFRALSSTLAHDLNDYLNEKD